MQKKLKKIKPIPKFKNEDAERDFWATHSAVDYFDFSRPIKLDLSHLKPSTQPVTVRLPTALVEDLKMLANKHDVPYQSLMKILLARQIAKERKDATL
jgi:predicted DNA binding CopG/RHH family protein